MRSIADAMRSELSASVGNTQVNNEDDVRNVKDRLTRMGRFEEKPEERNGFVTRSMDEAIKGFQRDMGLRVDGVMKPGGETETMLNIAERKPQQKKVPPLAGPVGNSKKNSSDDVKAVQSLLSFVGLLPKAKEVLPSGILDASDDTAIRTFQRQNNLREDGVLNPGGETEQALKKAAQPNQEETEDASFEAFQKRRARKLKTEEQQRMQEAAQKIADDVKNEEENSTLPPERKQELQQEYDQLTHPSRIAAQEQLNRFKERGLTMPTRFLTHYLGGTGEDLILSEEQIATSQTYRDAMQENRRRVSDSIIKGEVNGQQHEFKEMITSMEDGETITLNKLGLDDGGDYWDRDIKARNVKNILGLDPDPEQTLSTGSVKIRTHANLSAERDGDLVTISGELRHTINDRYDFNSENLFEEEMFDVFVEVEEHGGAKSFDVKGEVVEPFSIQLRIDGDSLKPVSNGDD